jgi:hypothetical protein
MVDDTTWSIRKREKRIRSATAKNRKMGLRKRKESG